MIQWYYNWCMAKTKQFSFRVVKWRGSPGKAREEQARLINQTIDRVVLNERCNSGGVLKDKDSIRTAIFEVSNGNEVYYGITADPTDRLRQLVNATKGNSPQHRQTVYSRLRACGLDVEIAVT